MRKARGYANGLYKRWAGVWGYAQYNNTDLGTSVMVNAGIGYDYYKSKDLGITNYGTEINFFANLTQRIPGNVRISAYAGCYGGGPEGLYGKSERNWFHGFSLQRSFLKDDRLTISLRAISPFQRYGSWKEQTVRGNYGGYSSSQFYNREFRISVSYRFGSLKASVKKTNTTISNDDLMGGSSKGGNSSAGN